MTLRKWTIARRGVQVAVLVLIASPLSGLAFFSGNLSAASLFGIHLADPLAFLQATLAGRIFVGSFFVSALLVALVYLVTGGRTFCGWVCPVYLLTEVGDRIRQRMGTGNRIYPLSGTRYTFGLTLLVSLLAGVPLFEILSPIGIASRAVMFAAYAPLLLVGAILLVEIGLARRGWCRSLCPVGGFYALLGGLSPLRIRFHKERCTDCGECSRVCPVEEVLVAPLVDGATRVTAGDCTRCGACVDACAPRALGIGTGYR